MLSGASTVKLYGEIAARLIRFSTGRNRRVLESCGMEAGLLGSARGLSKTHRGAQNVQSLGRRGGLLHPWSVRKGWAPVPGPRVAGTDHKRNVPPPEFEGDRVAWPVLKLSVQNGRIEDPMVERVQHRRAAAERAEHVEACLFDRLGQGHGDDGFILCDQARHHGFAHFTVKLANFP